MDKVAVADKPFICELIDGCSSGYLSTNESGVGILLYGPIDNAAYSITNQQQGCLE
jgi:hypothetical protein